MPSIENCDCRGRQPEQPSTCSNHFREIELTSTPHRKQKSVGIFHQDAEMNFNGSRQEFLSAHGDTLTYSRKGGFFVTFKGLVAITLAVIALTTVVGVLVYLFAPHKDEEKAVVEDDDLWNIGKIHVRNVDDKIRILEHITPTYYRLRIKPNYTAFTFEGNVSITLFTRRSNIKHISLHAKDLHIWNNTVLTEQLVISTPIKISNQTANRTRRSAGPNESNDETATQSPAMSTRDESTTLESTTLEEENAISADSNSDFQSVISDIESTTESIIDQDDDELQEQEALRFNLTLTPMNNLIDEQPSNGTHFLSQIKNKRIKIISKELKPSIDRLIFSLESHLKPNVNYTLEISFSGVIDDSLTGFYRSDFMNNNTQETLLVTQFEPTSARKAFPCFDEPNFKAMFEISIASPNNMTALSNMPLMGEKEPIEDEDMVWNHFQRSIPMSPYLVAYSISDLEHLESKPVAAGGGSHIPFRVWTRRELLPQSKYAAEIGPKIFKFYVKYFGVPYALPKIDLLGIPDFASGAMENWGMLTFSEPSLLLDPDSDSMKTKKIIATMLAHELSHQWFGNLVTMKWWNDLWLNEGFATYLEYIGIDAIEPSWGMLEQFTSDRMQTMISDCLETTRPVSSLVNDETQIGQIFDDISYIKAASLLRMLNHILTEEVFHEGLVQYMQKWQFKNAEQNDLWMAFTEAANDTAILPEKISIADLMKTWTLQSGYPVINATRNYVNGSVTLTQNRFYLSNPTSGMTKELWYVPLTYAIGNTDSDTWDTIPNEWLVNEQKTIQLPDNANETWVYFNVLGIGHYRVNYDHTNWKRLQYGLDDGFKEFPTIARAQILDDAFNLARAGQLNYSIPFDVSKYMIGVETEILPWEAVLENLVFLDQVMQRSKHYDLFQEYVSRLIMPTLTTFGFHPTGNETTHEVMLRDKLIEWACLIEEQECVDWAWMYFNSWVNETDPDKVNPIRFSHRPTVYKTIIRLGSKKEFNFMYKRYQNSNDPEVQMEILRALPSTRNSWLLYPLFDYSITTMQTHLTPAFWSGVENDITSQIAFKFIIMKWEKVNAKYALMEEQMLQSVVDGAFRGISTETELRQFKRFIASNKKDLKNVSELIMKHLEHAVLRIQWRRNKMEDVEKWLIRFSVTKKVTVVNEESTL